MASKFDEGLDQLVVSSTLAVWCTLSYLCLALLRGSLRSKIWAVRGLRDYGRVVAKQSDRSQIALDSWIRIQERLNASRD